MPRKIIRSSEAENDLIEIWLAIAAESPLAADRELDRIDARSQQLLAHPHLGVARDEVGAGLRCLVYRSYLVFYRVA